MERRVQWVRLWGLALLTSACSATAIDAEADSEYDAASFSPGFDLGWRDGALAPRDASPPDGGPPEREDGWGTLTSPCEGDETGQMLGVSFPDGRCYLIDRESVSRGDFYREFLRGGPFISDAAHCEGVSPGGEPRTIADDACARAFYFQPEGGALWPPDEHDSRAMICVNWCDADSYCARVGKRLCRNYAEDQSTLSAFSSVEDDEVYNAMTASGRFIYAEGAHPCEIEHDCWGPYEGFSTMGATFVEAPGVLALMYGGIYTEIPLESGDAMVRSSFRCCDD